MSREDYGGGGGVEIFYQIGQDDEFDGMIPRPCRSGRSAVLANRSELVYTMQ